MWQGLCNGTVSVRLSQISTVARTCSAFAAVGPGGRYRRIATRPARSSKLRAVSRFQPPSKADHRLVDIAPPCWPHPFARVIPIVSTTGALPAKKGETTAMVIIAKWPQVSHTAFSYSTYSRRHVIGRRRRFASPRLVGQIRLIITRAVRHLATTTLRMINCDVFRTVWSASKVSRYLSYSTPWGTIKGTNFLLCAYFSMPDRNWYFFTYVKEIQ